VALTGTKTFQNYIGGEWVDSASGETFESTSPATGDSIGVFPKSNAEDADRYSAAIHDFLSDVVHWPVATPRRSAGVAVAAALARGGIEPALAVWRTAVAEGEPRWNLAEYELQYVGRQCTLTDRHDAAAALFRANRDRFPDSPLAWYELGRALAAAGQRDDARRALQHSLALEPAAVNPSHDVLAGLD